MSDGLAGVSVFVAAAEAESFASAAARLHLSRSAVGKTVARLERRLGARLFHRTTRSQSLTEEGQAFYERCLRALAEIRAGEALLESGRREAAGRLRVSAPVLFGRRCVAPILVDLARRHPKLELEISFSDRRVELVEEGFDLAVRNGALDDGANLTARRIALQRMTVCASPAYLAAHGTPRTIGDVARIRRDRLRSWRREALVANSTAGRRRRGSLSEDQTLFGRPRSDRRRGRSEFRPRLATLLADPRSRARGRAGSCSRRGARLELESYAVWPQSPRLPMRVRLAIDTLAAELPGAVEL